MNTQNEEADIITIVSHRVRDVFHIRTNFIFTGDPSRTFLQEFSWWLLQQGYKVRYTRTAKYAAVGPAEEQRASEIFRKYLLRGEK